MFDLVINFMNYFTSNKDDHKNIKFSEGHYGCYLKGYAEDPNTNKNHLTRYNSFNEAKQSFYDLRLKSGGITHEKF